MKNKIMSVVALLTVAVLAFAFKPVPTKVAGTLFELKPTATDPFDPQSYQTTSADPSLSCFNESKVCIIEVPAADLISGGPNDGLPNVVNTAAAGELADEIQAAISTPLSPRPVTGSNGRVIWEKN